jgi:uncharacterized sporulation protein YeaH/YhbH (DUF444 family)
LSTEKIKSLQKKNLFKRGYAIFSPDSSLKKLFFRYYILKQKADVFHAMKSFFREESGEKMA